MANDYDEVLRKCQSALRLRYDGALRPQAERCFDDERQLIEERGFSNVLVQVVEFATEQRQHGRACHLIGSGCSSMINYLLDLSEVDPIEHRTLFKRFLITSDGSPPTFQFVVASPANDTKIEIPVPENVSVHPMTPLEQIPVIVERKFPEINIPMNDPATFDAITAGDTDGVFQFETEYARKLAARIRPRRIDDLEVITALAVIECSEPSVVADFLARSTESSKADHQDRDLRVGTFPHLDALLFQESILLLLHHQVGLTWSEAYRFLLDAAKGRRRENHSLWKEAVRKASQRCQDEIKAECLVEALAKSSSTATCCAHHLANAITSYRAAFLRTHQREQFDFASNTVAASSCRDSWQTHH